MFFDTHCTKFKGYNMFLSWILKAFSKSWITDFSQFWVFTPFTLLFITFFAQSEKFDSTPHWKADKIVFPIVYNMPLYKFFSRSTKISGKLYWTITLLWTEVSKNSDTYFSTFFLDFFCTPFLLFIFLKAKIVIGKNGIWLIFTISILYLFVSLGFFFLDFASTVLVFNNLNLYPKS